MAKLGNLRNVRTNTLIFAAVGTVLLATVYPGVISAAEKKMQPKQKKCAVNMIYSKSRKSCVNHKMIKRFDCPQGCYWDTDAGCVCENDLDLKF